MLNPSQISELFSIIEKNSIIFVAQNLGHNYLSTEEKERLMKIGIDPTKHYIPHKDYVLQQFYLGLISDAIGKDINKVTFKDIEGYLKSGKYIPMTFREKSTIESIKKQFLGDIKGKNGKIFADVNQIINKHETNNRKAYEDVIRDEVERGKILRKTNRQIANEIHHKTGDWSRDFDRIVEFIGHQAFDEGRAALYERQEGGDVRVYKDVYPGACKHCIRLYLTNGIGSEPKTFELSTLRDNGTNIGRKVADLKPVIGSTHNYCRCTLNKLEPGMEWDDDQRRYVRVKKVKIEGREPVKFTFKSKEYHV